MASDGKEIFLDPESGTEGEQSLDPSTSNPQTVLVNRVSIRVPPFWPDRPGLWFASLEAQFHINGITQELTKYYYAVSQLDTKCASEVEDIIIEPPKEQPYTCLKKALISRFSLSYEEKVRRLLEKEEVGDRKPSSFLRHLRTLAGPSFPEQLLLTIWTNRLPHHIQGILVAQKQSSLEDSGDLADKLQEISAQPMHIHAASKAAVPCDDTKEQLRLLQQQVADLTRLVTSLTTGNGRNSRSRSGSRSRTFNGLCWYHKQFAANASKCIQPCTWSAPATQGNSNSSQ